MIATHTEVNARRTERRPAGKRPSYLSAEVLDRAASEGDARLIARARKQRGE